MTTFTASRHAKRNGRNAYKLACELDELLDGQWVNRRGRTASTLSSKLSEYDLITAIDMARAGEPFEIDI